MRSGHDRRGLNQLVDVAAGVGVMPIGELARGRVRASRCDGGAQAADLAVAQSVIDEREEFAGHRDAGFVLAAPFGDPVEVDSEPFATVVADDGFECSPAHDLGTLLGDATAGDFGV